MTLSKSQNLRSFLLGGLLPVLVYTVVEEVYGTWWGLVAGMILGAFEIGYEFFFEGKVSAITWGGNLLLVLLGVVALTTNDGVWFKLQPAILELVMGGFLLGSVFLGKPVMTLMAEKQGIWQKFSPELIPYLKKGFERLTARLGIFFLIHAAIAAYAALHWSTQAWALLKGVGFTGTMIIYMVVEALYLRRQIRRSAMVLRDQLKL